MGAPDGDAAAHVCCGAERQRCGRVRRQRHQGCTGVVDDHAHRFGQRQRLAQALGGMVRVECGEHHASLHRAQRRHSLADRVGQHDGNHGAFTGAERRQAIGDLV